MDGYTLADWTRYSINNIGSTIIKMTFDDAVAHIKNLLGNSYRITDADNDRTWFIFMRYLDNKGERGEMDESSAIYYQCSKIYN